MKFILAADYGVYVLWIIIAAIAGIAHLVRKAIEKATSGEKGKRINLAEAVHKRIRKYMDPLERTERPPPREEHTVESVSEAPRLRDRPSLRETMEAPIRRGVREPGETREPSRGRDVPRKTLRETMRGLEGPAKPPPLPRVGRLRLDPAQIRNAVLMAELLGPPVSERDEYRLF